MRVAALASTLLVSVSATGQTVPVERPEVLAEFPHDPEAFTQGLLLEDGVFYESTGLVGKSTLRRVDPTSGRVLQVAILPAEEFGEGLASVEDRLIQLTWQNGVAHVYDRTTLRELETLSYDGEGWGLCFDGERLVMSNGSSSLYFRDPDTFELEGTVEVTLDGEPLDSLNELECVGSLVYANVWKTDLVVRIDRETGKVVTRIDCAGLLDDDASNSADVLNGIAYDPATRHFFFTGKLWPKVFEVRFPFAPGELDSPPAGDGPPGDASAPIREPTDVAEGGAERGSEARVGSRVGCRTTRFAHADPHLWLALVVAFGVARRFGVAFRCAGRQSQPR